VTTDARGGPAGGYGSTGVPPYAPSVDASGRRVVFITEHPLDPGDRDDRFDVYVKDIDTGRVFWISTEDIAPGDAFFMGPELDPSGRWIFFTAPPGDGPVAGQVFMQDLDTGHRRLLSRVGAEPGDGLSFVAAPNLATDEVFVLSTAPLSANDEDQSYDLFAIGLRPARNR
ncbi:MAG: hypothetical protein AAFY88_30145, partial [Acidobacteriota bacterium]